ncbi:MAG TPA: DUF4136 domain-containing protein [Burkholderiales bacterium]|nr:DUF4136 domain-containing protein [Burkholderiales bacterium]
MGAAIAIAVASVISMFVIIGHNIAAIGRVDVGITAYAQSELPPGKQFVLQGPDPRYPGGDPSWPTYARILTKALEAKGFVPVASSPDLIIRVTYRIGDTLMSVSTTTTPTKGGSAGSTSVSTTNLRTIQIEALDAASAGAGNQTVVWSIHAQSRGTGDSLAKVFPVMVAAMEGYVGVTAEQEVKVSKYDSDPEVVRLTQP